MVSYYEHQNADPFYSGVAEESVPLAVVKVETMRALGVPLMNAIIDVRSRSGDGAHPARSEEDARNLSSLVKTSMSLVRHISGRFSVNNPEKALAVRVGLIGFVGGIVADYYKIYGTLPDQDALFDLLGKVDAVLSGVDLKKWVSEASLTGWNSGYRRSDTVLSTTQLEVGASVIQAVTRFSFGFEPEAMVTYLVDEIKKKVQKIAERLVFSNQALWERDMLESVLIKSLASLYVECHMEEIARLNGLTEQEQQDYIKKYDGAYSLDPVWKAFDMRVHMLQILADHLDLKSKQHWADVA